MGNKSIKIINIIFLSLSMFIVFSFYFSIFIIGQKDESVLENKSLTKIPMFHLTDFIEGTYQDQLESSIIDQMIYSENIKGYVSKTKASLVSSLQSQLIDITGYQESTTQENEEDNDESSRNIKYIPISHNIYHYGNSPYMIFKYFQLENRKDKINQMAQAYNKHFQNIDSYFYFVNQSKSINFNTVSEEENEFLTYIKTVFNFKGISGLKIDSYKQYKDYFYETDHHWNYKGSYQGYKDIIQMIYPDEKLLEPIEEKTYNTYYYGSNARTTSIYSNKEKFTVYKFDLPSYTTYINHQKARYGNETLYDKGDYSHTEGYNHYSTYYGGDFAEVVYDYNQPDKDNLLLIAPSYSNANNQLIASHFNKTYVIDLRHYQNEFGKSFNPEEYCKENQIDKFVLMLSIDHLTNDNFMLED